MKDWKFYALLAATFIAGAGIAALTNLLTGSVYAFYAAIVLTVMTVHSSIYAEWQYLHHRTKDLVWRKPKAAQPVAGST